jgi:hypothetical protein
MRKSAEQLLPILALNPVLLEVAAKHSTIGILRMSGLKRDSPIKAVHP